MKRYQTFIWYVKTFHDEKLDAVRFLQAMMCRDIRMIGEEFLLRARIARGDRDPATVLGRSLRHYPRSGPGITESHVPDDWIARRGGFSDTHAEVPYESVIFST